MTPRRNLWGKYTAGAALALLLLAGVAITVWRIRKPHPAPATPVPAVSVAPKERTIVGHIEAIHTVPVPVPIPGEVDSFSAEVGQEVFEGQVLARISNQGLETGLDNAKRILENAENKFNALESGISAARLEAVRARDESMSARDDLDHATREYQRQRILNDAGATPRNTYQKAQKGYEAAEAKAEATAEIARQADEKITELTNQYNLARKTLEDKRKEMEEAQSAVDAAEIRAPVGGVVLARQGEIGETLTPEQASALFSIATDLSALRVVFPPDPSMKPGDRVTVSFTDVPVEPITAAVTEIKNDQATAEFTSPNAAIRPGMTCTVHATIK